MTASKIGPDSVRGSGTNGYIQRSYLAQYDSFKKTARQKREEHRIKKEEKRSKSNKKKAISKSKQEILEHDRRRKVELQCLELRQSLEDSGEEPFLIDRKVSQFKQELLADLSAEGI